MKKGLFQIFLISNLLFSISSWASSEMLGMNFKQEGETSELELLFDSNDVNAHKFHVQDDKQIIIDLKDVSAKEKVMRAFDTSEFSGAIVFVSAYKKPGSSNDIRVAIQLRDNVRSVIKRQPNRVILEVENRFGVFAKNDIKRKDMGGVTSTSRDENVEKLLIPKSDAVEDILSNLTLSGKKKYIGKKISINVKDLSVADILKMIADASGFNIILTKEVKDLPPLTLNLTNIPWDQALDTVLGLNKLVARKNGIILMVTTLAKATEDQKMEAEAKKVVQKDEPLVTKIFPISYAKTDDIEKILQDYLTPTRGKISKDNRINALIIKDTPETIERIRKIIETLDTQTPQVLIESKIVEVSESYSKEIGLKNGLNFGYDPIGSKSSTSAGIGSVPGDGIDGGPGFAFSSAPVGGDTSRSVFTLAVTRFNRLFNLGFELQLMESESKGKIIASPKVITQNKKKAVLSTTDTDSFRKITTINGEQTTSYEEVTAKLNLEVTPQVTNEGAISLEIALAKEQFGDRPQADPNAPPRKQGRNLSTNVLVDNGSTIVLGGIYNYERRESHSGIPVLKDIPLLGWLFRTPYAPSTTKSELVIFLTPRIINQKEAGLVSDGT